MQALAIAVKHPYQGQLLSKIPGREMPSPSSGAYTDEAMECAGECSLIAESRLNRDLDQRHGCLAHQLLGVLNAMLKQPLVRGDTERGFE